MNQQMSNALCATLVFRTTTTITKEKQNTKKLNNFVTKAFERLLCSSLPAEHMFLPVLLSSKQIGRFAMLRTRQNITYFVIFSHRPNTIRFLKFRKQVHFFYFK